MNSMSISIIGDAEEKDQYISVLKACHSASIPAKVLTLGDNWRTALPDFFERLKEYSKILLFMTDSFQKKEWFPYVIGFVAGRENAGLLYIPDSQDTTEKYDDLFNVFTSLSALSKFLSSEKAEWIEREKKEDAKKNILDAGLGLSAENLAFCVENNRLDAVKSFLALGFSPDTVNVKGVPILVLSIRNNNLDIASLLIKSGADVNKISDDRGNTALMEAAAGGKMDLLNALLEAEADLDLRSKNGQTALMLAVGEGNTEESLALVKHGADTEIKDALGMSARKYAELFKHQEILSLMDERKKESGDGTE